MHGIERLAPVLLVLVSAGAQDAPADAGARSAVAEQRLRDWREDLAFFAKELPARHKNAFFHCAKTDFEAAVAALDRELATLPDDRIIVRLMQLAALIGDFHTGIGTEALGKSPAQLPFAAGVFADGVFVVAARAAQPELVGSALLRFGDLPIEAALRRVASVVGYENEATFKHMAPRLLANGQIAHALGLTPAPDQARLTVRTADGSERTVDLTMLQPGEQLTVGGPQGDAVPLYRQKRRTANWWEALPQQHAVYVHYWRCADEPGQRVADFADDVLAAIDTPEVHRLVIDLRGNGGGNSALLMPLIQRLGTRENLQHPGAILVLVGRGTFSSAHLNAMSLQKDRGAVLLGEPTGQKPNAYGEVRTFALPHSGIQVRYSTKFWQTEPGDRPSTEPDVTIAVTSGDFFAGRDPVLEAALGYAAK